MKQEPNGKLILSKNKIDSNGRLERVLLSENRRITQEFWERKGLGATAIVAHSWDDAPQECIQKPSPNLSQLIFADIPLEQTRMLSKKIIYFPTPRLQEKNKGVATNTFGSSSRAPLHSRGGYIEMLVYAAWHDSILIFTPGINCIFNVAHES
ncbi:hypothetical protein PGT21_035427 [Puccinia graminis f. sp. tritici]|uniref:Uncharacterized protein n=1 Tax=Puccinia graminis f. sp. tritici TaxID=56615 RepID=A0A5B0QPV1_PUCGR|nr:hypothetical protein PGT21_035427 [Puccinia graminis f. sp. tritici]